MLHLPWHYVEELYIYSFVYTWWMYPYQRDFKGLKGYVRTLAKLERSIAQGYQVEEAYGFFIEYMVDYNLTTWRVWDDKEEPTMIDKIQEKNRGYKCFQLNYV